MQSNLKFKISILVFVLGVTISPVFVFAAELYFEPPTIFIGVGDTVAVTLFISSPEGVNALEGELVYSDDMLLLEEVRTGNSIVPLWIERPSVDSLAFAGAIPGGFYATGGEIATYVFRGVSAGSTEVALLDISAFLNDGLATHANVSLVPTKIVVESEPTGKRADILEDTEPPLEFTPVISKSSAVFEGQWFVSFLTQDKKAGIRYYDVAEKKGFLKPRVDTLEWRRSESPYLLKDQTLQSWIFVKAVDGAGNERIAVLSPSARSFYQQPTVIGGGILLLLMILLVIRMVLRKKYKL